MAQRAWGGGTVLNHAGDNTMIFANVWMATRGDLAILVRVNQSGNTAFKATDEAVAALLKVRDAHRSTLQQQRCRLLR